MNVIGPSKRMGRIGGLAMLGLLLGFLPGTPGAVAQPLRAAVSCSQSLTRDEAAAVITLTADCETDSPLTVPSGWTFNGGGHQIQAIDPPGGVLAGGVIEGWGDVVITNVTIDGAGLREPCSDSYLTIAVWARNAGGRVSGIRITNFARPGDELPCAIGIRASGTPHVGELTIVGNELRAVEHWAIWLDLGAQATVSSNTIVGGEVGGVLARDVSTRAVVTDNTLILPGTFGMYVIQAKAEIERNDIQNARQWGIVGEPSAPLAIRDNQVTGGERGILLHEGIAGELVDNSVTGTTRAAILIEEMGTVTIRGNQLEPADGWGIVISKSPSELKDNQVHGGTVGVILSGDSGQLELENTRITGVAEAGIVVQNGAVATIRGGEISKTKNGVQVTELAGVTLAGTSIHDVDVGVQAAAPRTAMIKQVTLTDVSIADVAKTAVSLEGVDTVSVQRTVISRAAAGIEILRPTAMIELTGNELTAISGTAIKVTNARGAVIEGNSLTGAASSGIVLTDGRDVVIKANQIVGDGEPAPAARAGILAHDVLDLTVTQNEISGMNSSGTRRACGIWLTGATTMTAMTGNDFPPPGNKLDLCDDLVASPTPG